MQDRNGFLYQVGIQFLSGFQCPVVPACPDDPELPSRLDIASLSRLGLAFSLTDKSIHEKYQREDWVLTKMKLASLENSNITTGSLYFYGVAADGEAYPIDLYTLGFEFYPSVEEENANVNSIFTEDIGTREAAILSIHNWCIQNVCKWMKIDQPRSRAPSRLARKFFIDVPLPFIGNGANFMRAALANAMHALGTKCFATDFWEA